jgi:copper oxidase (laccase) domain-containing protein
MFVGLKGTGISGAAILKEDYVGTFNFDSQALICMNQVHGNQVVLIERDIGVYGQVVQVEGEQVQLVNHNVSSPMDIDHAALAGVQDCVESVYFLTADAVISNSNRLVLSVKTADCLPVFMYAAGYMAVVHAGRQGTLLGITERVCRALQFLSADHVDVWFGPASCVMCYEIHKDTHTHFNMVAENKAQIEAVFNKHCIRYVQGDADVLCTQCQSDQFFSYRSGDTNQRNVFYFSKQS